jgi:hypothetical protein
MHTYITKDTLLSDILLLSNTTNNASVKTRGSNGFRPPDTVKLMLGGAPLELGNKASKWGGTAPASYSQALG